MSNDLIGLILDVVVLVFLAVTIVYVWKLFKSLNDFKAHRHEFDGVITSLLSSIDQAERSVQTLKQVSAQEAGELEDLIQQSKAMSEELKIINEAGENMAKRLETLAEKNRKAAHLSQGIGSVNVSQEKISSRVYERGTKGGAKESKEKADYSATLKNVGKEDVDLPSFMIQDREFENVDSLGGRLDATAASNDTWDADEDESGNEDFQSQAERELFDALRASKRDVSGKGRL